MGCPITAARKSPRSSRLALAATAKLLEMAVELRIRHGHALGCLDLGIALGDEARDRERHGDPVVLLGVDERAAEPAGARDDEPVGPGLDLAAHGPEVPGHGLDPVAFLH